MAVENKNRLSVPFIKGEDGLGGMFHRVIYSWKIKSYFPNSTFTIITNFTGNFNMNSYFGHIFLYYVNFSHINIVKNFKYVKLVCFFGGSTILFS